MAPRETPRDKEDRHDPNRVRFTTTIPRLVPNKYFLKNNQGDEVDGEDDEAVAEENAVLEAEIHQMQADMADLDDDMEQLQ